MSCSCNNLGIIPAICSPGAPDCSPAATLRRFRQSGPAAACLIVVIALLLVAPATAADHLPKNASAWVDGYYVGYQQDLLTPEQIPWDGLTYIMMSRVKANADGSILTDFDVGETEGPVLAKKIAQYAHANNTGAILMLGGSGNGEAILGAVRDHRDTFIEGLVTLRKDYGYDGYDLDWEDHLDWPAFAVFARELRNADPDAVITMPTGCININYETVDPGIVNVSSYVDQLNIMSYYPATTWSGDGWESWFVSPLTGVKPTTPVSIEESLKRYVAAGIPREKLGMGIGFHAIGYTNGVTGPGQPTVSGSIVGGDNVYPLSKLFGSTGAYDQRYRFWDKTAFEPYLSLPEPDPFGARYLSFEDEESILAKGNFTRSEGFGGTIIWTINQGNVRTHPDPHFLMHALKKGFIDPNATLSIAVSVNPPSAYVVNGTTTPLRALVTGTPDKNVTWSVTGTDCGSITPDGIYSAPDLSIPGEITTCTVIAASRAEPEKQATAIIHSGDAETLAWDPGLNRTNCAEWWMEVVAEDPNTTVLELEHDSTWTTMTARDPVNGKPVFALSHQVKTGDSIRYRASSADGRKATTVPLTYTYTGSGESVPCPIQPPGPDRQPPGQVSLLHALISQPSYITWIWNDPADPDFADVLVYLNDIPSGTVAKGMGTFNATGLSPGMTCSVGLQTRDTSGNINKSWVNDTVVTPLFPDTNPPLSVTNLLNTTTASTYITWRWTDPADPDFTAVEVSVDGTFRSRVPKGTSHYTASLLEPDTEYTISTRTLDLIGNVNQTWVNRTTRTIPSSAGHWVSGYYVGYQQALLTPDEIAWGGLSHIMMSRVKATANGTLNLDFDIGEPAGPELARKIAQYAHTNNTKAILMLGGAGNGEAILGAVRDHRADFIGNLVTVKNDYGYDGYDLDWEDNIDWPLFETFVRELREADPGAVITMPVGCINSNYESVDPRMVNVTRYVDQVNMMSYYPATAWAGDGWESWYVSPLSGVKSTTPISIEDSLARYAAAGVEKSRLGMGIGFFAIGYTGNITGPNQATERDTIVGGDNAYPLSKLFGSSGAYHEKYRNWDPVAVEPYMNLSKPDSFGARYVSFEDEVSILAKGNFTLKNGYGGTIIWTINQGNVRTHSDPHFLMHALRKGFLDPDIPLATAISVSPPVTYVVAGSDATFRALVTGADNRNVTWDVVEPDGGTISPDGVYTAPKDVLPNVTLTRHIRAVSQANPDRQATAVVNIGDAATLAWDPGLHRMNCAQWWMEVWAEDANISTLELEHDGARIPMSRWSDYWGMGTPLPNFAANVHVEPGEIIRFRAKRADGRTAVTLPINYTLTASGEILPCPVEPPVIRPRAGFSANVTCGKSPLTVQFTDLSTGSPISWAWDFGDGDTTNATEQNPVHTFLSPGVYDISLNVTSPQGSDTLKKIGYISVSSKDALTLVLSPGWNFVSTPKRLESGNNTALIFAAVDTSAHSIWQYDAGGRKWVAMTPATRVGVLDGIWIYSNVTDNVTFHFSADPLDTPPSKDCFQGWNAIGFSDIQPLEARSALMSVHYSWTTLIGYDAGLQEYETSIINGASGSHSDETEMLPGKGYWLYMTDDQELGAISA